MNYLLEVAAFTVDAAIAAQHTGAHRIELCDNPAEGGTTPSFAAIQLARKKLSIHLFPISQTEDRLERQFAVSGFGLQLLPKLLKLKNAIGAGPEENIAQIFLPQEFKQSRPVDHLNDYFDQHITELPAQVVNQGCIAAWRREPTGEIQGQDVKAGLGFHEIGGHAKLALQNHL